MLTAAQAWTSQGRKEGKKEGKMIGKLEEKIEMVERFLKAGAPWEMVINATGITQEKLEELKATLQEMVAGQTQLVRS